jgi:hypothetical protein
MRNRFSQAGNRFLGFFKGLQLSVIKVGPVSNLFQRPLCSQPSMAESIPRNRFLCSLKGLQIRALYAYRYVEKGC